MSTVVKPPANEGVFIPYADPPKIPRKHWVKKHMEMCRSACSWGVLAALLPVPKRPTAVWDRQSSRNMRRTKRWK